MMHLNCGLLMGLLLLPAAGGAQAPAERREACTSWSGEPKPLPTVAEAHRGRAEWAKVRVAELSRLARVLEGVDPVEAHRFWKHARCIAPDDQNVTTQVARSAPLTVHHALDTSFGSPGLESPDLATSVEGALLIALTAPRTDMPVEATEPSTHLSPQVSAPPPTLEPKPVVEARVAAPPDPVGELTRVDEPVGELTRVDEPLGQLTHVDEVLDILTGLIQEARFRSALEMMVSVRQAVQEIPEGADQRSRWARVELLAGTAQVALGQNDVARRHFREALQANPRLELGQDQSPKVRRVFAEVKAES